MLITRRCVDGVAILDVAGRLTIEPDRDRPSVSGAVLDLVSERRLIVLVHLSRMTDIDAYGLGDLAWSCATLRRAGGQMALVAPRLRVRRLLAVTRLDTVLPIYDSEYDAIARVPAHVLATASAV